MACLLTAAAVGAPEVTHLNQRNFQIPLHIEEARRAEIKQLILYASLDGGKSWEQVSSVTPDKDGFNYYAPNDGLFMFKVQVENQQGHRQPEDIYKAPVGQQIFIDTVRPQIMITGAERQGDDVLVRWEIKEDNLDPPTLKLEYRTADMPAGAWNPVSLTPAPSSQVSFKVNTPGAVSVRMQVQDLAGNSGTATADAPAPGSSAAVGSKPPDTVPTGGSPGMGGKDGGWSPTQPVSLTKSPAPDFVEPPSTFPPASGGATFDKNPPLVGKGTGNLLVASTATKTGNDQPVYSPGPTQPARGEMPRLQIVNSSKVTLQYEVNKFGPSGVGSVELYVTRDDGQKWERYGEGQNLDIPVPADSHGPSNSVQRSLTVTLPGEGIYGFYLVVKSGAGLGKPAPKDGVSLPQMRIEVDETAPQANLYAPVPDPQQKDCLILTWTATDRNLAEKPITLQWAERAGGPWETIGAAELPNTGKFTWKLTSQVPPRVYLRLVVRDTAGNIAEAVTPQPILVDLSEPEVRFIGLTGSPK